MRFSNLTPPGAGLVLGIATAIALVIIIMSNPTGGRNSRSTIDYRAAISPVHLKEKNNADRRTWVEHCLNHIGGETTLTECTLAAQQLYPEQDWVELAKSNMATMVQPKSN